mgnify:CR=1 FL=1
MSPQPDPGALALALAADIERRIAELRRIAPEPVSIAISADVDVEIRPASHDDRVIVGHRAMGDTVVNYRPDGLTVEVFPKESIDPVHSIAIESADLYEEEVFG